METEEIKEYESPCVEVIEVAVEQGFATSSYNDGVSQTGGNVKEMKWGGWDDTHSF